MAGHTRESCGKPGDGRDMPRRAAGGFRFFWCLTKMKLHYSKRSKPQYPLSLSSFSFLFSPFLLSFLSLVVVWGLGYVTRFKLTAPKRKTASETLHEQRRMMACRYAEILRTTEKGGLQVCRNEVHMVGNKGLYTWLVTQACSSTPLAGELQGIYSIQNLTGNK